MRLLPTTFAPALGAMIVGCTLCTLPHGGGPASDATAVTPMAPQRPDEAAAGPVGEEVAEIDKSCWVVFQDRKGNHWFGSDGQGVCRFDGSTLDWMFESHLTEVPGGGWFGFRSIIQDRSGAFWVCSTQYRFEMMPHGAAGQQEGLIQYRRRSGMDLSAVATTDRSFHFQSVAEDDNGHLWMAPYAGGVWRYDGASVTHYPMKDGDQEITMVSISKDRRGDIWVGTHEHGAYRFNGTSFVRFRPG